MHFRLLRTGNDCKGQGLTLFLIDLIPWSHIIGSSVWIPEKVLLNDENLERIDNFDVMALFLIFERRKGLFKIRAVI